MSLTFQTPDGLLEEYGAYVKTEVRSGVFGLATNGVLILVGEADAGPDYSEEEDLTQNFFGPDSLRDVEEKYGSGRLVDAYRGAVSALADERVAGALGSVYLVKTNPSVAAELELDDVQAAAYGTLVARQAGQRGNLISVAIQDLVAESRPSRTVTWIPNVDTVDLEVRLNGGAALSPGTLAANRTPTEFQTAINGLAGIDATGGALRTVIPGVAGNLTLTASGNQVTIAYDSTWTTVPTVGDTLVIPVGSVIAGAADANVGAYVVTGAASNSVTATKLSDAGAGGAVPGVVTAPVNVGSTPVAATTDFSVYSPVTITQTSTTTVDGLGKTLEVAELTSGADLLTRCLYELSTTPVDWVSTAASPTAINSSAERQIRLTIERQVDQIQELLDAGGQVVLELAYDGTTATVTISDTTLTTTVVGGSGSNLSLNLAQFPTISDLAAFIDSQPGYQARAADAAVGQIPPTWLDDGTYGICTTHGAYVGRVKADARDFFGETEQSVLVQLGADPEQAEAGLPATVTTTYLAGGAKGASTDATFQAAIQACERLDGNFVIPLVDRDASQDVLAGETESASTYTADAVRAAVRAHYLKMSTFKRSRPRQGVVSSRGTFAAAQAAAAAQASHRAACTFQACNDLGANGIQRFGSWMMAVKFAAGQAAAFYRALTHKQVQVSGVFQEAGDWDISNPDHRILALRSGLAYVRLRDSDRAPIWAADNTCYLRDRTNFVFNSFQAVYMSDVLSRTTKQNMEDAITGETLADMDAGQALNVFRGILSELVSQKVLVRSDDAPKGFKDETVVFERGVGFRCEAEVKLNPQIAFIPVRFTISAVQQSAG